MSNKKINQSIKIKASPHEVYEVLMDSDKHAQMTGDTANISRDVGGHIKAWGDYIDGTNVELIPDKKIVQKWRASDWPQGHYSTATFEFKAVPEGTNLIFTQTDVPQDFVDSVSQGWHEYYWQPLKMMLEKRDR